MSYCAYIDLYCFILTDIIANTLTLKLILSAYMNLDFKLQVVETEDGLAGKLPPEAIAILERTIPDLKMCLGIHVKDKWLNYHLHKTIGSKMFTYQFYIFTWRGLSNELLYILRQDNG